MWSQVQRDPEVNEREEVCWKGWCFQGPGKWREKWEKSKFVLEDFKPEFLDNFRKDINLPNDCSILKLSRSPTFKRLNREMKE